MKTLTSRLLLATSLTALAAPVFAAGGLSLLEIGTHDLGLAGAGYAARADDAATAVTNPAGMTRIKGDDVVLGTQLLYGNVKFDSDSNTTVPGNNGGNLVGVLPGGSAFYVHSFSDDLKGGMAMVGNFGLAGQYNEDFSGRYYTNKVTLLGVTLAPSLAYKVTDKLSLALGLNAMYALTQLRVPVNNVLDALPDGKMQYEDSDWGYSGTAGLLYEFTPNTRVGITYTSDLDLKFSDTLNFANLGPGMRAAVNVSGLDTAPLNVGMTVPQSVMTSAYHRLNDQWAVMGNLGWQDWSEFGNIEISIDTAAPVNVTTESVFKDTWHAALGTEYQYSPQWMFTTGLAYDSTMVTDKNRSVALPVGATWAWGLGAKYQVSEDFDVSLGYELKWGGDLPVDQSRGPLSGRVSGEYTNVAMNFFSASFHWKF